MDVNITEKEYSKVVKAGDVDESLLSDLNRVLKFKLVKNAGDYFKAITCDPNTKNSLYQFFGKCIECGCDYVITVEKEDAGLTGCECGKEYFIKGAVIYAKN